jgi:phosphoglycolate phosphatase
MQTKFRAIIFDLDGTLVDTIGDIAASMNRALERGGFPPLAEEAYIEKVGWGIKKLAFLALPEDARNDEVVEKVAADASRLYAEKPLGFSKPYPGIRELITEVRRRKLKTAVLTNKPDPVTQSVIGGLFLPGSFDWVQGDRPGVPRKPDPGAAWELLLSLDVSPRETVFMGDSEVDMETARAANCHALGVSWGFRPRELLKRAGAQRIIDHPGELLEFL